MIIALSHLVWGYYAAIKNENNLFGHNDWFGDELVT